MICYQNYVRSWLAVSLSAILLLSLFGCGTITYMNKKYVGYKVINKNKISETKKVPIRITSCVSPQGYVLCERRYGAFTKCNLRCETPPNKWVERPEGYGGYEDKTYVHHYLTIESPKGKVKKIEATEPQYNAFYIGQIIGKPKQ